MKNFASRIAVAAVIAASPASAFAHAGAHDAVPGGIVQHMLTSPFHLGIVAVSIALAVFGPKRLLRPLTGLVRRRR